MSKRILVALTALIVVAAFAGGTFLYNRSSTISAPATESPVASFLIRPHAPIIGPTEAPVTIVEFFDPSCEACRAFYPIVKQIMGAFPNDVRLVLRYAPFHEGSDVAVRILEAARIQGKYQPVLESLLANQPQWAMHGAPDLNKAWELARTVGLDVQRAQVDATSAAIDRVLEQDIADVKAADVRQTPTFFVNGKPLTDFGPQQLYDLVGQEVKQVRGGS